MASACCGLGAMSGWPPPPLPADTELKRRVDRMLPRSGLSFVIFFAIVIALLNVRLVLSGRLDLVAVGVAGLASTGGRSGELADLEPIWQHGPGSQPTPEDLLRAPSLALFPAIRQMTSACTL